MLAYEICTETFSVFKPVSSGSLGPLTTAVARRGSWAQGSLSLGDCKARKTDLSVLGCLSDSYIWFFSLKQSKQANP